MTEERDGQIVTFYSYQGGTGRTMALANTAWILAANGQRVLVADWDLESPGLHRFFAPFLDAEQVASTGGVLDLILEYEWESSRRSAEAEHAGRSPAAYRPGNWHRQMARVWKYAFPVGWEFPGGGSLDLLLAGRHNPDYGTGVAGLGWDNFYNRQGGALFFDALREDMKRHYDWTLLDSRTGLSDVAEICTIHLPDVLVDCFTLSDRGIDGAAAVATRIRDVGARRTRRVLPVPMRVKEREAGRTEARRALAMQRFAGLPDGMTDAERRTYWHTVGVPYRASYAYEETLATFGDRAGDGTTLLAAYETLTSYLTGGRIRALPRIDEALRRRTLARFAPGSTVADQLVSPALVFNPPSRNPRFTGRKELLRRLREELVAAAGTGLPVVLRGGPGIGKTQLAIEYAHRFRGAYDVVWWIPADPPQFVDVRVADLGDALGLPRPPTVPEMTRAVRQRLSRPDGGPPERWLLVFDGVDDYAHVRDHLPQGTGHVLITSRDPARVHPGRTLDVTAFERAESVAHLRGRVSGLSTTEAEQIADAVENVPSLVALAGAWLADTGAPAASVMSHLSKRSESP